jgi:predicted NUDIX family phosphoesterase
MYQIMIECRKEIIVWESNMEENVLVINKKEFSQAGYFKTGFNKVTEAEIIDFIKSHGDFMPRSSAERNYDYFQVIPYMVVFREHEVFLTQRTKKQSEVRLHEKRSIGVGGHLNNHDGALDQIVRSGMNRELKEELEDFEHSEPKFMGTLIDDSVDVSLVHLGLVYRLDTQDDVQIRETGKMEGMFVTIRQLEDVQLFSTFESWSGILIKHLQDKTK